MIKFFCTGFFHLPLSTCRSLLARKSLILSPLPSQLVGVLSSIATFLQVSDLTTSPTSLGHLCSPMPSSLVSRSPVEWLSPRYQCQGLLCSLEVLFFGIHDPAFLGFSFASWALFSRSVFLPVPEHGCSPKQRKILAAEFKAGPPRHLNSCHPSALE